MTWRYFGATGWDSNVVPLQRITVTDQPEPTEEDVLREEAKRIVATPPEPIPDAAALPADVRDGYIDDDLTSPNHIEGE